MKAKKYGGLRCLRPMTTRRHLFYNQKKGYSLDEIREYSDAVMVGKYWEVHSVSVAESMDRLVRRLILSTPYYEVAWDMVKDADHDYGRNRR